MFYEISISIDNIHLLCRVGLQDMAWKEEHSGQV